MLFQGTVKSYIEMSEQMIGQEDAHPADWSRCDRKLTRTFLHKGRECMCGEKKIFSSVSQNQYVNEFITMGRIKKSLVCTKCGGEFASRQSLYVHEKNQVCVSKEKKGLASRGPVKKFPCTQCNQQFTRKYSMQKHMEYAHAGRAKQVLLCGLCPRFFKSRLNLSLHREQDHGGALRGGSGQFRRIATAHRRACEVYRLILPARIRQTDHAIRHTLPRLEPLLRRVLLEKRNARVSLVLTTRFRKAHEEEDAAEGVEGVDVLTVPMSSSHQLMRYLGEREHDQVATMLGQINNTLDAFVHNGSGWVVTDVLTMDVNVLQCQSLQGSCSAHLVEYKPKMGLSIVHKDDRPAHHTGERCFFRAVAAAVLYGRGEEDPTEQQLEDFIHAEMCENVSSPVDIRDIEKFEQGNMHLDVAVNVMFQDDEERREEQVFPVRASSRIEASIQANLMLFHLAPPPKEAQSEEEKGEEEERGGGEEEEQPIMHYAWIRNMSDIMGKRKKSKNGNTYKHGMHLCFNCFLQFHTMEALTAHVAWCHQEGGQRKIVPEEGERVLYEQYHHEAMMPYCFVFDFETLQKTPEAGGCSCTPEKLPKCQHKTQIITEQEPFAYALLMVDKFGTVCEDLVYEGEDAAEHFVNTVLTLSVKYKKILADNFKKLEVTPEVQTRFDQEDKCRMCHEHFNFDKVMDHDHLTGKE